MNIEIEIKDEDIICVLTTALEGGSNYWYWIDDIPELSKNDKLSSENVINWVLLNPENKVEITDVETDEILGYLCKDNIKLGIELFIENCNVFDPAMDANDADNLFQYIVLGKIIYG